MTAYFTAGACALVAAGLLLMAGANSASAKPRAYEGKWAPKLAQCRNPQDTLDAPWIVTRNGYNQFETHCTFSNVTGGGKLWRANVKCLVEGSVEADKFVMRVVGSQLRIAQSTPAGAYVLHRCR